MITLIPYKLQFKRPGGTSRGVLYDKDSWFLIKGSNSHITAIGEVSILNDLSPDNPEEFDSIIAKINHGIPVELSKFPAMQFGLETLALSTSSSNPFKLYDSEFIKGKYGIPINGLIWMGTKQFMFAQIKEKLENGFRCLKLKIGALDFDEEIVLIQYLRRQFPPAELEIRVDANGAFTADEALEKLKVISSFHIHSIEQPISPGQWEQMHDLCRVSPVNIALDEELIGVKTQKEKSDLLDAIQPQYIILKPSLIGGLKQSELWIEEAQKRNIGWWATSALESNVGLNAIAQWIGTRSPALVQGLGTGGLYTNNISSPLTINHTRLWYHSELSWDVTSLYR